MSPIGPAGNNKGTKVSTLVGTAAMKDERTVEGHSRSDQRTGQRGEDAGQGNNEVDLRQDTRSHGFHHAHCETWQAREMGCEQQDPDAAA